MRIVSSLLVLIVLSAAAFSGTTGKITGLIKAKKTGEPVIGANIRLSSNSFGAASNIDGTYFIVESKFEKVCTRLKLDQAVEGKLVVL